MVIFINDDDLLQIESTERNAHVVEERDDFIKKFHDGILYR
ncbi:hypothetical protein M977_04710 [Buttiauxella gaviniae ATCC 51604]|uniref:Uncharacterized protein n=1 Tax=Buttiauxella gaviniae ATCC 51604 TaxID=1354253 RepID=A0A1B7HJ55_9ENTR|nr:hypothetical protein M977_04710 [Buttiauxella gaviniae ATCC 51604]